MDQAEMKPFALAIAMIVISIAVGLALGWWIMNGVMGALTHPH
jgi:uncharacterized protein YneF (UPF0154 family)